MTARHSKARRQLLQAARQMERPEWLSVRQWAVEVNCVRDGAYVSERAVRHVLAELVDEGSFVRGPKGYAPVWERVCAMAGEARP